MGINCSAMWISMPLPEPGCGDRGRKLESTSSSSALLRTPEPTRDIVMNIIFIIDDDAREHLELFGVVEDSGAHESRHPGRSRRNGPSSDAGLHHAAACVGVFNLHFGFDG